MNSYKTDLLLIFTRNPELGKCKTRLASSIGDHKALEVYIHLLNHTESIVRSIPCTKEVYFSEDSKKDSLWDNKIYNKKLQQGTDLGARMYHAFKNGFENGFSNIIIIGSDIYDLDSETITLAFEKLHTHDYVIGPAQDGGYYLLGMKKLDKALFENKKWGSSSVLQETIQSIGEKRIFLLPKRNDIDVYEDLLGIPLFEPYLKNNT